MVEISTIPNTKGGFILDHCHSDDEVEKLDVYFTDRGWERVPEQEMITRTTNSDYIEEEEYHTIILPYHSESESQTFIFWSSLNQVPSVGYHITKLDTEPYLNNLGELSNNYGETTISDGGKSKHKYKREKKQVIGGDVESETTTITSIKECGDVDWQCVASIAGSSLGALAACGACATTLEPLSCTACLGTVLQQGEGHCEWCNDND
ncbi:hypothetical protein [Saliphagus sp. LR7]|uniref:hypothetical protein n=1 Tax=Saliphagus sp. LR7 TaxID=2282654 RepID=UPI0013004E38|nr:hypothetical protein [Saliphagus sp. LR7]